MVLVLPGGRASSRAQPMPLGLARLRMLPLARAVQRALPDVAVGTVRYRYRGWNGHHQDPVHDVRAVLAELVGTSPVVLLGHSMGGRTAVAAAAHPRVAGVVGLAPWLPDGESVSTVRGRTVVLAHGDQDQLVPARLSARWAERAQGVPDRLARFVVTGDSHAMLRRARWWTSLAVWGCRAALGREVDPVLQAAFDAGAQGELAHPG
ncbi:alpha/beta fold hydrolase [Rhodococcus sp. X156]|uniref:alpha/beta hydrolase n=1 Tax=Rhodococcus sp. X156 TaxID=2499145 RepID=UPI0019D2B489|nr:alpha/beta fold hydrolase [Rhodococcus sp. X156]